MDYQEKLSGKVAIVTGGAQGMGFAIADMLADCGVKVVVCDIKGENAGIAAEKVNAKINANRAYGMKVDVTDEKDVCHMVDIAVEKYGNIDILVNCAGILKPTRIEEISKKEWICIGCKPQWRFPLFKSRTAFYEEK